MTTIGDKNWQTVEVENGTYNIELYATSHNAWWGQWMPVAGDNPAPSLDGDADNVAYVFGRSGESHVEIWITARCNSGMNDNEPETYAVNGVNVTDGKITFGIALAQLGKTEWHTIQIKSLKWITTAKEIFAELKKEFDARLFGAAVELENENKTNGKEEFGSVVNLC